MSEVLSVKKKLDILLSILNSNNGAATITVSGDIEYDTEGIIILNEDITTLKIDSNTQKFIATEEKNKNLGKKILYRT